MDSEQIAGGEGIARSSGPGNLRVRNPQRGVSGQNTIRVGDDGPLHSMHDDPGLIVGSQ